MILRNRTSIRFCPLLAQFSENSSSSHGNGQVRGRTARLWPYTWVTAGVRVLNGRMSGDLSDTVDFLTREDSKSCVISVSVVTPAGCISVMRDRNWLITEKLSINVYSLTHLWCIHLFHERIMFNVPTCSNNNTSLRPPLISRLPYNLYCVGGDVKHCSIQSTRLWFLPRDAIRRARYCCGKSSVRMCNVDASWMLIHGWLV